MNRHYSEQPSIQAASANIHMNQQGTENRAAGRDYFEYRYAPSDLKLYLLLTPEEELDKQSITNEELFVTRFGFSYPQEQRSDFVYVKQTLDFTKKEMQLLIKSKHLTLSKSKPVTLSIHIDSFIQQLLIIVTLMMAMTPFMPIIPNAQLHSTIFSIISLGLIYAVWRFYRKSLLPIVMLKKRGIWPWQTWSKPNEANNPNAKK